MRIGVIIPALNEERAIGRVVAGVRDRVDEVVVVDNGSTDATAQVAAEAGATVVREPVPGYGRACLRGIAQARQRLPDVYVFMDGDAADDPEDLPRLLEPIERGEADFVVGSRTRGGAQRGAMTPQQRFGGWLACLLMRWVYGVRYTDLGPFRAITARGLDQLAMDDRDYGWTIQMQVRAAVRGLRERELAVAYRRRIGKSKIAGTVRGVIGAGTKILSTVFTELRPSVRGRYTRWRPTWRVCVLCRYPTPGACKTRLIPALGAEGAADLHRRMAEQTVREARRFCHRQPARLEVWHTGADADTFRNWLGDQLVLHEQPGGDLGARLIGALRADGPASVMFIGTDCPSLTAAVMGEALHAAAAEATVIGPASDGGYYLIANPTVGMLTGIDWGSAHVLRQTLERAGDRRVVLLDELTDVDRPEDLDDVAGWAEISRPDHP